MSKSEIKSLLNNRHLASQSSNVRFNPSIGLLKPASVLLASIALVACGGSGGGSASVTATAASTNTSFDGVWRACEADGADSDQFVVDFKSGILSFQVTTHLGNTTCSNSRSGSKTGINTIDYTLGSTVTVDGTVSGITTATKVDFVEGALMPDEEPAFAPFQLVAIQDNVLFLGDADGANNGTTELLRPTQLDPLGATKQVALTSINGTWLSSCKPSNMASEQESASFLDGDFTLTQSTFATLNCSGDFTTEAESGTYTLGSQVTVQGIVKGITNATQFNFTASGKPHFELIAISGTEMFFGNTDGTNDGTTEELRSTQLESGAFTKQEI